MSAQLIHDHAPLGAIIAYADGTPRPPDRHKRKLADWKTRNGKGRLIGKRPAVQSGRLDFAATFTLHKGDYGREGTIFLRVHQTFSVDSTLSFAVLEPPAIGSILVFTRPGDDAELVYLAANRLEADDWLTRHGYPDAVLKQVSDDGTLAEIAEGRVA